MADPAASSSTNPPTQTTEELDPSQLDADPDVDMVGTGPQSNLNASSSTIEDDAAAQSFGGADGGEQAGAAGSGAGDGLDGRGLDGSGPITAMDVNVEEGRMPLRKDASLRELMSKMDEYTPVVCGAMSCYSYGTRCPSLPPPPIQSPRRRDNPHHHPVS